MGLIETIGANRQKSIETLFLLIFTFAYPIPASVFVLKTNIVLGFLWLSLFSLLWALWFFEDSWFLFGILWIFVSGTTLYHLALPLPLFLAISWVIWKWARETRMGMKVLRSLLVPLFFAFSSSSFAEQGKTDLGLSTSLGIGDEIFERQLKIGRKLVELGSCVSMDNIAWKPVDGNRLTRLLFRDVLRLSSESKFFSWELTQLISPEGWGTFVFRRHLGDGLVESMVFKDNVVFKVHSKKSQKRIMERRSYKSFVNRAALVFEHHDGSTVTYLPVSAGSPNLQILQSNKSGRTQAPLILRGNICFRPPDKKDGATSDDAVKPAAPDQASPTAPKGRK